MHEKAHATELRRSFNSALDPIQKTLKKLEERGLLVSFLEGKNQSISVETGSLVICVNNGEAIIKKIQRDGNTTILISLNTAYPPFLASNDFRIIGEVKGVISTEN